MKISTLVQWGAAALMVGTLAACGGGGGSSAPAAPAAPAAGGGTTAPAAAAAAITAAAAVATNDTATAPTAALTVVQDAGIPVVTVNSPPKVNFTVISDGAVVKNLTTSNASFIIAKLVPGTNGTPDQWVSYTYRTKTGAAGTFTQNYVETAAAATQLVYNDAGYYTYTFTTDIKDPTKTNGVVFEPNLTHRVAIQLNYTNKAGQTVKVNPYFDFTIDASGNAVAVTDASKTRKMVDITTCNECHSKLAKHGGNRVDTQFCVLCHNAASTDHVTGNVIDFRTMVHKIHAGEGLKEWFGQSYKVEAGDFSDVRFPQDLRNCTKCHDGGKKDAAGNPLTPQGDNWKNVPSRAACGACHAGIDFATGKGATIANAEADAAAGVAPGTTATGHIGGAKKDDSQCVLCHDATTIPEYHIPVTPIAASIRKSGIATGYTNAASIAANQANLPAGAIKVTYAVSSVSRNASKQPVIVFQLLQNGVATPFNDPTTATELWANFVGTPSVYFVWAEPQDGITAPADFNKSASSTVKGLWNGSKPGTLIYDAASGSYTATLTGVTVPDTAVMLTGGVGFTYDLHGSPATNNPPLTQTNLADYPYNATSGIGGLIVAAPTQQMVATGYTARRQIVDTSLCNKCHEKLGVFTASAYHAGQRNDANTCAWCHTPNRASSGWSVDSEAFIHGIHAADKRTVPFNWRATSATDGFFSIGYPGKLQKCEACHLPGTYDFSASASSSALPNRLYRTTATGAGFTTAAAATSFSFAPADLVPRDLDYGTAGAAANLVSSPIAAACFACHDGKMVSDPTQNVRDHIEGMGQGSIYRARGTAGVSGALIKQEGCILCHGPNSTIAPIKAMHAK